MIFTKKPSFFRFELGGKKRNSAESKVNKGAIKRKFYGNMMSKKKIIKSPYPPIAI
jgi:hypothetical protein